VSSADAGAATIDPSTERILDANFNRAREAIRVMEDFARLGRDDAGLAEAAKSMRHELSAVARHPAIRACVRARDIVGDVGAHVSVASEYERTSPDDVAVAAAKRLSEALRVIEESLKTLDAAAAARVERLRYRGYELERQLAIRIDARQRLGDRRLYVIITERLCRHDWFETARAAIEGGADMLQLREKDLDDRELLGRARRLASLCRSRDALFIVNDRPDLAVLAGADGVHVGQDDLPVADVRRIVGGGRIIGLSTHTVDQARTAMDASPDYIAVGPMFDTPTKPQSHIAGPAALAEVAKLTSLPLVAIGGVTADRLPTLLAAGARCVCACSAVICAADPAQAARALKQQMSARCTG